MGKEALWADSKFTNSPIVSPYPDESFFRVVVSFDYRKI